MTRDWTEAQREVIQSGGALHVSAAAGSGKTAVMVARIVRLIEAGTPPDSMLVVTFTRAAASEMRARIVDTLAHRAQELGSEGAKLFEQSSYIELGSISTIDAFCAQVIARHYAKVGLDPTYRTLQPGEARALRLQVLEAVLEARYDACDMELDSLLGALSPKNDSKLKETVLDLHELLSAQPNPEDFIARSLDRYNLGDEFTHAQFDKLSGHISDLLKLADNQLQAALDKAQFSKTASDNLKRIEQAYGELSAALKEGVEAFSAALAAYNSSKTISVTYEKGVDKELKDTVKRPLEQSKKHIAAIGQLPLFKASPEEIAAQLAAMRPLAKSLFGLVVELDAAYAQHKRQRGMIDFSDMGVLALKILRDDDIAREFRRRFGYVFVDEYQDTSSLQEAIIERVSRGDNLFTVGDVKQSIYRFRLARLELFIDRAERYEKTGAGRVIHLTRNFRSQRGIVDAVNMVFSKLMSGGAAGGYGETDRMITEKPLTAPVELNIFDRADAKDEQDIGRSEARYAFEARAIGNRLIALHEEGFEWRDMVVLFSVVSNVAHVYSDAFTDMGIPAFTDSAAGLGDTIEVKLLLNLLHLIDNPDDDVRLISILSSGLYSIPLEFLARLRSENPGAAYYDMLKAYSDSEGEHARTLGDFFTQLDDWTFYHGTHSLRELLELLLTAGIYDYAGALPGGQLRRKNLDLITTALSEQGDVGLFEFLQSFTAAQAGDGQSARALSENDDVVRLMTIHKSKGLEFPCVALADLGHEFRPGGRGKDYVWHHDLGLALKTIDLDSRTKCENVLTCEYKLLNAQGEQGERLRLLYVAMTRAKDRLLMFGSAQLSKDMALSPVMSAKSMLELLLIAIGRVPSGTRLELELPASRLIVNRYSETDGASGAEHDHVHIRQALREPVGERDMLELKRVFEYYGLPRPSAIPSKVAAGRLLSPDEYKAPVSRPPQLREGALSPTERGSLLHKVLEHLNLNSAQSAEAVMRQVEELEVLELIEPNSAQSVDCEKLAAFAASKLGRRMAGAQLLKRELPFTLLLPARLKFDAAGSKELLVQGVIDACFLEEDEWVLVDFKSDRGCDAAAAIGKYGGQLSVYAHALKTLTGRPVREAYIYMLETGAAVPAPLNALEKDC